MEDMLKFIDLIPVFKYKYKWRKAICTFVNCFLLLLLRAILFRF